MTAAHPVSAISVRQNIEPVLHVFSSNDVDPEALPGDWHAEAGRDAETGHLPFFQSLIVITPRYHRTLRQDVIARRAVRAAAAQFSRFASSPFV